MNLKNRSIYCKDNLDIMKGINSKSIDLIYLDPPFNKKKEFTAPIGSSAEGASFSDIFRLEDIKAEWLKDIDEDHPNLSTFLKSVNTSKGSSYNFCYLAYMAVRLIEMQRILKDNGSLYLHCDPTMSHYLKLVLDHIFGEKNFKNEIIWHYEKWSTKSNALQKNHDIIFYYSKSSNSIFNEQKHVTENLKNKYEKGYLIGGGGGSKGLVVYNKNLPKVKKMIESGKYDVVYSDETGKPLSDVWDIPFINPAAKERTGYPTQKPLKLLERIIAISSNEGDLVLDPFCGCATTCIAAEKLNRKWIGIDVSIKAHELVKIRLDKEVGRSDELFTTPLHFSTDPPQRTDSGQNIQTKKYVYIITNEAYPNEFKVGIATNPKSRLTSYNTADPNRGYEIKFQYLTPHFREIEKFIHQKYNNRHEWVCGKFNDIKNDIEKWESYLMT